MDKDKKLKGLTGELNSSKKYLSPIAPMGMLPNVMSAGAIPKTMPGMSQNTPVNKIDPEETAKEFERLKVKLEDLKKKILKKYKFTRFLSILPQQSLPFFAEDENMPIEIEKTNPLLLFMCIPEDHFKEIPKIRPEVLKLVKESKQNVWVIIKTEVDLWHYGLDSKFEFLDSVSASFPLYDNGFLGTLRLANIHKSLVLRKFEKYVASYVIAGSLVRGVAGKDSDVDTFVIIDDTDVKRMPRIELLEKLRGMIYDYIKEANALAGVKNPLNVQVYLLTDFWQSVKDAHPVMFTFIRDGIPLYDRGTFIPWKLLLQMGKIKPSPEAVDMFMKSGDQTDNLVKRRLLDAMVDIFWGIVTPTQALMMLAGQAPPEPKAIVQEVKKTLIDKEGLMTVRELKFLEKIVKLYKDYEHVKLNEISGKEIDELKKESDSYVKKMKSLRAKIEDRMQEHEIERINSEFFDLMKNIFGSKGQEALISDLDSQLVRKGKISKRMLGIARDIAHLKKRTKSKKLSQAEMQKVSAEASELMNSLMEYSQRKDLVSVEKSVLQISYGKDKKAEIVLTDSGVFVVSDGVIKKISAGKIVDSDRNEFEKALASTKDKLKLNFSNEVFDALKKEFGEFRINL